MTGIIFLLKKILRPPYYVLRDLFYRIYRKREVNRLIAIGKKKNGNKHRIFYLGITTHSNLGDMAQYYCIRTWLRKFYTEAEIYEFESHVVVDTRFNFIENLKALIHENDMIVFQSGYTTQDLGGDHELMHRLIIDNIPEAKILMMPQTIFFNKPENKAKTAKSYNRAKKMLFLARDNVSYNVAIEMFPDITIKPYPDIVTSLIGRYKFKHERKGILIYRRNDGEKFYSEEEIIDLKEKLETFKTVYIADTTIEAPYRKIRKNLKIFIEGIIDDYSKYELIITDRYHGTIFSLAACTPVVVLKTTDHKVATGVDWFKGVYDDYVTLADSMDDAFNKAKKIISKNYGYKLEPHFNDVYYQDKLKKLFKEVCDSE